MGEFNGECYGYYFGVFVNYKFCVELMVDGRSYV